MQTKKITVPDLLKMKHDRQKITMLTAYDFPMSVALDNAGIDIILVGDSVGNVILGYDSTVGVSMDELIHHAKAVNRGRKRAFLIADMPFMSFNVSCEQTIINAGRFIKEAGADAVKIEGGSEQVLAMVKAAVGAGIPVMGHIGLTPQTATVLGGFKVQGKDAKTAKKILQQALDLEKAGCFSVLFECIPDALANLITKKLSIPTIGIGAGIGCDGQVLVSYDLLGLHGGFVPRFVKKYAELTKEINSALEKFIEEVRTKKFPDDGHCFKMKEEDLKGL